MIFYNVTVNVDESVHEEWLAWMKDTHIPDVLATGFFTGYKIMRVLTTADDEMGKTYAIQYALESIENYEAYKTQHGPRLQADTLAKFGDRFVAFRTLLEEV